MPKEVTNARPYLSWRLRCALGVQITLIWAPKCRRLTSQMDLAEKMTGSKLTTVGTRVLAETELPGWQKCKS